MISGHAGSLSTVHANTPRDAAIRLETLCMMSDVSLPVQVARTQVASALHVIVNIARLGDGSRRVQCISEALGLDDRNQYVFTDLFRFQAEGRDAEGRILGRMLPTGTTPTFAAEPRQLGYAERVRLTKPLFPEPAA